MSWLFVRSCRKAIVSFERGKSFVRALEQDGLDLGDGHKLSVTKCLELLNLPWHGNKERGAFPAKEERGEENAQGGSTQHVHAANWLTPSTGKLPNAYYPPCRTQEGETTSRYRNVCN